MNIHPGDNEEAHKEDTNDAHVPFDGFVNINDLVRDRHLRDAAANEGSGEADQQDPSASDNV